MVLLALVLGLAHSAFAQQVETPSGKLLVGSVSNTGIRYRCSKVFHMPLAPTGARC